MWVAVEILKKLYVPTNKPTSHVLHTRLCEQPIRSTLIKPLERISVCINAVKH